MTSITWIADQQFHQPAEMPFSLAEFQGYVKAGGKLADLMSQGNHPNRKGHDLVTKKLLEWFPE